MYEITIYNEGNIVLAKEIWYGLCIDCAEVWANEMVKKLTEETIKKEIEYSIKYYA